MEGENKNYNILLVEDNKLNQTVIIFTLKRYGYAVDVASNGLEAIKKCKEKKYDFILMDIMMPGMDGIEATQNIRKNEKEKHTPIIALTADIMINDEKRCFEKGMDGYISKPFEATKLFSVLKKLGL